MMESNIQDGYDEVECRKEVLYVFETGEAGGMAETGRSVESIKASFWKILPCFIGMYRTISQYFLFVCTFII